MPTKLLYLEDMHALTAEAWVIEVGKGNDQDVVVLDQTILYPQGGGQPCDQGMIESAATFRVEAVRFIEGTVKHYGVFENGSFSAGETVTCRVNAERRALHSRVHSAGHVIDMAVVALKLPWIPSKAFHFPEGPYVEYTGSLEGHSTEQLKTELWQRCHELIQAGAPTSIQFMDDGKRVVLYGDFGIPCGGTHVANLHDIGPMKIRKIKARGSTIRVSYSCTP